MAQSAAPPRAADAPAPRRQTQGPARPGSSCGPGHNAPPPTSAWRRHRRCRGRASRPSGRARRCRAAAGPGAARGSCAPPARPVLAGCRRVAASGTAASGPSRATRRCPTAAAVLRSTPGRWWRPWPSPARRPWMTANAARRAAATGSRAGRLAPRRQGCRGRCTAAAHRQNARAAVRSPRHRCAGARARRPRCSWGTPCRSPRCGSAGVCRD